MLALAVALEEAGHRVRLVAPPDFGGDAVARGLDFLALGQDVRSYMGDIAGALHGGGWRFAREMKRWGDTSLASQHAVLPQATADAEFVIAAGTAFLAGSVAELHGVPFRYVVYTPGLVPSREHTPIFFPFQWRVGHANRVLWRAAAAAIDAMALRQVNRYRATFGLARLPTLVPHLLSERPLVAVDAALAPMPADCPFAYDQIRCLHPFEADPLPADLERFLAAGPPPVYLGFGSMPDPDPTGTTARLLCALQRLGCRALIARGWAGLGDGPLPAGVMAIEPVSHASLFPRVAAVVHHGGAGTTHTAARAGVPQVVVPHVLDQFYFARRAEMLGVAPPAIRRSHLNVARLTATLRTVLETPGFAARASELGRRLADLGPVRPDAALVLRDPRDRPRALAA
jgi:UDP:flavonoid glycosyltransferase YjiC (YdhE family)